MKRILAIFLVLMFMIPIGTMANIGTKIQPIVTQQIQSIAVGDVINGEEVVWVAPNVDTLKEKDVAYLTSEKTEINLGKPVPLSTKTYYRSLKITARDKNYLPLVWTKASGKWYYYQKSNGEWTCKITDNGCDYGKGLFGYEWEKDGLKIYMNDGKSWLNDINADGYFLRHTYNEKNHCLVGVQIFCGLYGGTLYFWEIDFW